MSSASKTQQATNATQTSSPSANPETGSSTISPTASSTSSAVTSGTTGIAAFKCQPSVPLATYTSPPDTPFIEECYVDYTESNNWNDTATVQDIGPKIIAYDFESCIDQCVSYNQGNPPTACRAVTYNANLTSIVTAQNCNCFLKSDRGGKSPEASFINYQLVASAYMKCVTDLTC